jgi:hypothetical protein
MNKLMCLVLSAVVIALCRAIRVVCLHDVSMIVIGVEGADQGKEEPSSHHVAPGMSLPQQPSHPPLQIQSYPDRNYVSLASHPFIPTFSSSLTKQSRQTLHA